MIENASNGTPSDAMECHWALTSLLDLLFSNPPERALSILTVPMLSPRTNNSNHRLAPDTPKRAIFDGIEIYGPIPLYRVLVAKREKRASRTRSLGDVFPAKLRTVSIGDRAMRSELPQTE
jgi:hypothetical protein